MELENFKELWNKDSRETLPEVSLEKQNEIHSPLQMIKINMKTEFWLMAILLPIFIIDTPLTVENSNIRTVSIFAALLIIVFIIYFYSRFLKLYKMLQKGSINTNYDLFSLKTQLLISKEIYIAYYISCIPLAFLLALITIDFRVDKEYNLILFVISFCSAIIWVYCIIKYWIYYMYGRYIENIIQIVDELNGIEGKPKAKRKKSWFERSQQFLMEKLGMKGNILNTVLWLVLGYITIMTFIICVASVVVLIGISLDFIDLDALEKAADKLY